MVRRSADQRWLGTANLVKPQSNPGQTLVKLACTASKSVMPSPIITIVLYGCDWRMRAMAWGLPCVRVCVITVVRTVCDV